MDLLPMMVSLLVVVALLVTQLTLDFLLMMVSLLVVSWLAVDFQLVFFLLVPRLGAGLLAGDDPAGGAARRP